MASTLRLQDSLHVAIIMDGNGRWAVARGLPRTAGHRAGIQAARAIVETAPSFGISILTLFAFSSDNWRRPADEVASLMWLLRGYLRTDVQRLLRQETRLIVIGRRDRIPSRLRNDIRRIERATAAGRRLQLRIAIDYSSRDSILAATRVCATGQTFTRDAFARALASHPHPASSTTSARTSEVDLLIRTGGERRLSDFMLWESAYAELFFSDRMWPAFTPADLGEAIEDFRGRERRFGGVPLERSLTSVTGE